MWQGGGKGYVNQMSGAEGDERNILEKGGASMEVLDLKETSDKKDRSAWQVRTEGDEVEEATAEGGEKLIHAK